ncbi:hypothetical protein H0H92_003702 [Tricholoma furcatifolium]|nr:hypothetical protein H0H92_003702 [Tricholoma furcatifolium]
MLYSPLLLLAFLAFLAVVFSLVSSPYVQTVVHTLFVAALGGTILHLQVLANARIWMCIIPSLLFICGIATIFAFVSRLQSVAFALFLAFSLITLVATTHLVYIRLRYRSASAAGVTSVPTPHPQWCRTQILSLPLRPLTLASSSPSQAFLVFLLLVQITYTFATIFRITAAVLAHDAAFSSLIISLATHEPLTPIILLRLLDACFITVSLALVFGAYYRLHRDRDRVRDTSSRAYTSQNDIFTRPKTPPSSGHHSVLFMQPSSLLSSPRSTASTASASNVGAKHTLDSASDASSPFLPRFERTPLRKQSQQSPEPSFELDLGHDIDMEMGEDSFVEGYCPTSSPTSTASCLPSSSSIYSQPDPEVQTCPLNKDLSHTRTRIRASSNPNRGFKSSRTRTGTPIPALLGFGRKETKSSDHYDAQKKKDRGRSSSWSAVSPGMSPPPSYSYLSSHSPPIPSLASPKHSVQTEPGDCTDLRDPFAPPLTPPVVTRTWGRSGLDSPPASPSTKVKAVDLSRKRRRKSRTAPRRVSGVRSDVEGSMEVVMEDVGKETEEEEGGGMEEAMLAQRLLNTLEASSSSASNAGEALM